MEKLIYPINGINYILFELEMPLDLARNFENRIKIVEGIIQHTKYVENSWYRKYISIKCLIPEVNFDNFKNSLN